LGTVEEFSKQFLQVLDNPRAFEPKIVFSKRQKTRDLIPVSCIILINSSYAISGISSKLNMKGDLTKGKSLFDISRKYLESSSFKQ
jgi:hypothetical protein